MKTFYRRNLPHIIPKGGTFFVTYNLKNALPKPHMEELMEQYRSYLSAIQKNSSFQRGVEAKRYFKRYDEALHQAKGADYLKNDRIAQIVADCWHFFDGKRYELIAYTIMSNHVHVVLTMFELDENAKEISLIDALESVKKYSARESNKLLGKTGSAFWQHESYDRLIRDREELYRIISYVLDNPVKVGLCNSRKDWKWNYIKEGYNEFM